MVTSHPPAPANAVSAVARLHPVLLLGALSVAGPTLVDIARRSWSSEQGGHGPIVVVTGLWLIFRELPALRKAAQPGSLPIALGLIIPLAVLYALARITGTIEIESVLMYALLIAVAYSVVGGAPLRLIWFPLIYLLFAFPPPDSLYAMITQPLKIGISYWAVSILHFLGYPIASSGVTIQIGQYQLLVAAACAGVNSLISLTALGLFYSYLRYRANLGYMFLLIACIAPIAVLVNVVRVLLLLLITYYAGEAAGQGFFHDLAGITMFLLALSAIFLLDWIATQVRMRVAARRAA